MNSASRSEDTAGSRLVAQLRHGEADRSRVPDPAEPDPKDATQGAGPGGDSRLLALQAQRYATLSAALTRQRLEWKETQQDVETAVEHLHQDLRIHAQQTQRALQAQNQRLRAGQRRQTALLLGAALGLILLGAAAGAFVSTELKLSDQRLRDEVANLSEEYRRLSAIAAQDALFQAQLIQLAEAVSALSNALGAMDTVDTVDTVARPPPREETRAHADEDAATAAEPAIEPIAVSAAASATARQTPDAPVAPSPASGPASEEPSGEASKETSAARGMDREHRSPSPADPEPIEMVAEARPSATSSLADTLGAEPLQLSAGTVALQLLGVPSRDELLAFLNVAGLPERLYVREERRRQRPWYVIIHSLHPTQSAAREALAGLPPSLARLDPWIRPLSVGTELFGIDRASLADSDDQPVAP